MHTVKCLMYKIQKENLINLFRGSHPEKSFQELTRRNVNFKDIGPLIRKVKTRITSGSIHSGEVRVFDL